MINLNEEYTYYKEKGFINYCLGIFRYANIHRENKGIDTYHADEYGMQHFKVDYTNESSKRDLAKSIFKTIKNDERAYLLFRCDFDWKPLEVESVDFEETYLEIRALFELYCRTYHLSGFLFCHFEQINEEHPEVDLSRHLHIVYQEPFKDPTFSEYLQKMLS